MNKELDFVIDKLTNSILNAMSKESYATQMLPFTKTDAGSIFKKDGWRFNWKSEFSSSIREVYKLILVGDVNNAIQGLVSLEEKEDHIYMHLIESAPSNIGKNKQYIGVAGNLVAFACKESFDRGHEGNVSFLSKTQLINHYEETLGAVHFGGRVMIIYPHQALKLIKKYFNT